MENKDTKTWLITGASRGIGKAIAREALLRGDNVAGTARTLSDLDDLLAEFPERMLALHLDMDRPDSFPPALAAVRERFGAPDILVNNAGYGLQGMIEEVGMEQVRAQMETNFFGLVHLTQLVIPLMREKGSGYIVNVSSIAGLRGMPGLGIYNASKFAVEGFSEALAGEMKPFGIRVSVVEPGPYRTDWAGPSLKRSVAMKAADDDSPYADENARLKGFFDARVGNQPGDPRQIAAVLCDASRHPSPPLHMIFGNVAMDIWEKRKAQFSDPELFMTFPHEQYEL